MGIRAAARLAAAAFLCLLCGGCIMDMRDSLFVLPEPALEHRILQRELDTLTKAGYEYSPPASGDNRTAIQFTDIYNDSNPIAISFFRDMRSENRMYVVGFSVESVDVEEDDVFQKRFEIEGTGDRIDRVYYTDLTGDGVSELIIGWRVGSDAICSLSVYDVSGGEPELLLDRKYIEICMYDLTADITADLLIIENNDTDAQLEASLFVYENEKLELKSKAPLSAAITRIERVTAGFMDDNMPVVSVDSRYSEEQYLTDVFWYDIKNKNLKNLSLPQDAHLALAAQKRQVAVFTGDQNRDRFIEIPVSMPSGIATADENILIYNRVDWYKYMTGGEKIYLYSSYNDIENGWSLILPERWYDFIVIYQGDGNKNMHEVIFALSDDTDPRGDPLLSVRIYTGSDHDMQHPEDEFILANKTDMTITAKLFTVTERSRKSFEITGTELTGLFRTFARTTAAAE